MAPPRGRHGPRRRAVATATALTIALLATIAACATEQTDVRAVGVAAAGVEATPTTTTTTPPTTVDRGSTLPVPEPLPSFAFAETPEVVLGHMEIPRLGLSEPLHEGMTLTAINRGPSHWPGTALPGRFGNVVVAAHRTTFSRPFERLDELEEGDLIHFELADGSSATYRVRDVIVVPEAALGIATQTEAHTATLFACHPKGSATHRIVAKAQLLDDDGVPVDDDAALPPVDLGLREGDDVLYVRDTDEPLVVHDPFGSLTID
ncbi:MAG: class E sortase [Acidimicrobiia bacterium]|nr:class E sortase [Acidimicrobiia bacterium]